MKWADLIKAELEPVYMATEGLIKRVDNDALDWKPATGSNWMTTGQLLKHISEACGMCFKGFVTGDWGMPDGVDLANLPPDEMMPPAEKMPAVKSVDEALQLLAADKKLALKMLAECSEDRLESEVSTAPWGGPPEPLGKHLLHMVYHLDLHKSQLYYYLKLQGQPVNTMTLFGMG